MESNKERNKEMQKVKCFGYTVIVYHTKQKGRDTVVAKLGNRKAYAYCHPADVFDFEVGAKLASHRLIKGLLKEDISEATKVIHQIEDHRARTEEYLAGSAHEIERINKKISDNCQSAKV